MSDHDRFDAMLGALVLGEATEGERVAFAAHARACDACRDDAAHAPAVFSALRVASERDPSGPSHRDAIVRRIETSRTRRSHATVVALAWSLAACVAAETGVATGFFARVATAFATRDAGAVAVGRP